MSWLKNNIDLYEFLDRKRTHTKFKWDTSRHNLYDLYTKMSPPFIVRVRQIHPESQLRLNICVDDVILIQGIKKETRLIAKTGDNRFITIPLQLLSSYKVTYKYQYIEKPVQHILNRIHKQKKIENYSMRLIRSSTEISNKLSRLTLHRSYHQLYAFGVRITANANARETIWIPGYESIKVRVATQFKQSDKKRSSFIKKYNKFLGLNMASNYPTTIEFLKDYPKSPYHLMMPFCSPNSWKRTSVTDEDCHKNKDYDYLEILYVQADVIYNKRNHCFYENRNNQGWKYDNVDDVAISSSGKSEICFENPSVHPNNPYEAPLESLPIIHPKAVKANTPTNILKKPSPEITGCKYDNVDDVDISSSGKSEIYFENPSVHPNNPYGPNSPPPVIPRNIKPTTNLTEGTAIGKSPNTLPAQLDNHYVNHYTVDSVYESFDNTVDINSQPRQHSSGSTVKDRGETPTHTRDSLKLIQPEYTNLGSEQINVHDVEDRKTYYNYSIRFGNDM